LDVFQDDVAMCDFDHIGERIEAGLRGCRVLLVVYSQAMLASTYCRQELQFALLSSGRLGGDRARVLAVVPDGRFAEVRPRRLKEWRLPDPRQPLDQTAEAIARYVWALAEADDRRLGNARPPVPPARFPVRVRAHPDLQGRELDLWAIHDYVHTATGDLGTTNGASTPPVGTLNQQREVIDASDPLLSDGEPYLRIVDDVPPEWMIRQRFGPCSLRRATAGP
jgi:hypothetical protein